MNEATNSSVDTHITEEEYVKPCPFCGDMPEEVIHHFQPQKLSDGSRRERRSVNCVNKFNGCMGQGPIKNSKEAAIEAWNRRPHSEDITTDIRGECARCGGTHEDLSFEELSRPTDWTHWAPCPTNGEPIMLRIEHINPDE